MGDGFPVSRSAAPGDTTFSTICDVTPGTTPSEGVADGEAVDAGVAFEDATGSTELEGMETLAATGIGGTGSARADSATG
jgi:hypothetical protein